MTGGTAPLRLFYEYHRAVICFTQMHAVHVSIYKTLLQLVDSFKARDRSSHYSEAERSDSGGEKQNKPKPPPLPGLMAEHGSILYLFGCTLREQNNASHSTTEPLRSFALACRLCFSYFSSMCAKHVRVHLLSRVERMTHLTERFFLLLCSLCCRNHTHVTQSVIMGLFIANWPQYLSLQMSWLTAVDE